MGETAYFLVNSRTEQRKPSFELETTMLPKEELIRLQKVPLEHDFTRSM